MQPQVERRHPVEDMQERPVRFDHISSEIRVDEGLAELDDVQRPRCWAADTRDLTDSTPESDLIIAALAFVRWLPVLVARRAMFLELGIAVVDVRSLGESPILQW